MKEKINGNYIKLYTYRLHQIINCTDVQLNIKHFDSFCNSLKLSLNFAVLVYTLMVPIMFRKFININFSSDVWPIWDKSNLWSQSWIWDFKRCIKAPKNYFYWSYCIYYPLKPVLETRGWREEGLHSFDFDEISSSNQMVQQNQKMLRSDAQFPVFFSRVFFTHRK